MKKSLIYRLLAFLYVFIVGGQAFMTSANAAEIKLTFANEGVLPSDLSNDSSKPSTGSFNIGGYNVELTNCSQSSKRLVVASSTSVNDGVGSITFHLTQKLSSIKFNVYSTTSKGTMMVKVGETTIGEATTPAKGENTISFGDNIETKGKDCTIIFTKKTVLTTVTFVTDGTSTDPDPDDPTTKNWAKFVKYNDKTDLTNVTEVPAGQVISLESLAEGFMPNSAMDNNYVVVYTLDGNDPTFVAKEGGDNDKYWKDPKETSKNYGYVYRRGIALEGKAGEQITVKVSIFKVTKDDAGKYTVGETAENSFSQKFTLTESTRPESSAIKFAPATINEHKGKDYSSSDAAITTHPSILDITESCTASSTTKGNIIVAKYSTNSDYDIQQILNAANVALDNTTAGVFSTKHKLRKTSAVQISENGLISTDVSRAFYWYIPARKNLILEAIPSYTDLSMTGTSTETVKLTAYHLNDKNERVYVSLDSLTIHIKSNDDEIATTDGKLTYAADKLSATFIVNAQDNGTTRINVTSDQTSIVSENASKADDVKETAYSYNAAAADVTVKVIDGKTMAPPTINPETSTYHTPFKSSVQADAEYSAYYYVVKSQNTADTQTTPTPKEIKDNGKFIEKGQKIETDIEAGTGNVYTVYAVSYDEPTSTLGTRVVQSTYTYMTVEKPVLTPGIEGNDNFYSFDDKNGLTIIASVATAGAQVYYTINSSDDNVTKDNGILYDGSKKINIKTSSRIHAVAYKDGIYSDVVLYRYNLQLTDLDAPTFHIDNSTQSFTTRDNIGNSKINIKAKYTDENGDSQDIVGDDDKVKDGFTIYYSTDGQMPTDQSPKYEGAFTVSGTVKVIYAYVKADDGSISDRSSLTLTNSNLHVWETTEENCPNGILQNTHQELSSKDGKTLYVKADFGGFASETDKRDNKQVWDHYTSKETSCGSNIDGVGFYSIAPNIDAKDEMGVLYNHTKSNTGVADYQTHKSTFVLPAMGAYTKFEPQLDGTLTIYCFQEGALYYRDAIGTKECFNSRFLRKRPVYFVDEAGVSIAPTAVEASGTLSNKWASLETNNFADKGDMQNGIKQSLFTKEQTENIYQMFNKVITANDATHETPLTKLIVYMNDGTDNHKVVAGYGLPNNNDAEDANVKANTGVCIPSASFMKYTFPVEAGKTYFFFGWMTKLGIRGFGFEPSTTQPSGELDIKASKTESNTFTYGEKYATAKLNRTFEADKWTTLVLPFSVSASEVKEVFGNNTLILHYRTIQGNTMYFFKHYHQMIVAGTPVIIKPSQTVTNPTFNHIKIEAATVTDQPCNDYGYKDEAEDTQYKMVASYSPLTLAKGNYFMAKNGTVKQWGGANSTTLSGTNAYMTGSSSTASLSMAKASFDNLIPENMDGNATNIDFTEPEHNNVVGNIYNVNGQLVRKDAKNTQGLNKGIYIVNGKKVIVK